MTLQGTASARSFFLLTFGLSVPFYLIGLTGWRMPGLPMLPFSALMAFAPMIAALIRRGRAGGWSAAGQLVARLLAPVSRAGVAWLLLAVIIMPVVCLIEYAVLRRMGVVLPEVSVAGGEVAFLFAAFFVGAVGEELGWQGHAYGALRSGSDALPAALLIGIVWAAWHVIPYMQLGRGSAWILWHSLSAVALRVVMVWLYENAGGRVLIAVVFHAMINLSWAVFPEQGSRYDPFVTLLILAPLAALVTVAWGPASLARFRTPRVDMRS